MPRPGSSPGQSPKFLQSVACRSRRDHESSDEFVVFGASAVGLELAPQGLRGAMAPKGGTPMLNDESGRIGYLVLYFLGAPIGLLLLLWVIFGNNLLTPG